ncbi:recombinase family protein [Roseomonas nepalensis]|uniref:Recombinase family protein n=1 Tax=Muricoccus nepalensis TaxID=1854500 RepID=A0A502FSQ3_9PROT|nr:recombinase family protein [Roseomonas nepalensis]TPG52451.1 recombinase family protein [Roseomonas nepalensis]
MTASPPARFVAYYRVSTDKQGRSGLGLEAQRAAVAAHVAGVSRAVVVAEFVEVESGRKKDRPQLAAALAAVRAHCAVLVIAKLDRLARNVHFVSGLLESGVEFVAADMPTVNRLTVHILAAVAEEEARIISARTKAALAAAKARGVRLGNPNLRAGSHAQARAANAVRSACSRDRIADVLPFIESAKTAGTSTLQEIANASDARGVPTPSGRGARWHPSQVGRVVGRYQRAAVKRSGPG